MWEYEDDLKDYKFRHTTQEVKPRKDGLKPYNHAELLTNSYGAQAMVLREVGMDENSKPDWGADHDRLLMWYYDNFRMVCKAAWGSGELGMQDWLRDASAAAILKFGANIVNLEHMGTPKRVKITGFRVIRNSNVSSGFPVYTLQAVVKK